MVKVLDENIEFSGLWQRQGTMEVGVRRGAHFQLSSRDFLTRSKEMKPGFILLFTQDHTFDHTCYEQLPILVTTHPELRV
jgi:hypothetical protein